MCKITTTTTVTWLCEVIRPSPAPAHSTTVMLTLCVTHPVVGMQVAFNIMLNTAGLISNCALCGYLRYVATLVYFKQFCLHGNTHKQPETKQEASTIHVTTTTTTCDNKNQDWSCRVLKLSVCCPHIAWCLSTWTVTDPTTPVYSFTTSKAVTVRSCHQLVVSKSLP